MSLSAIDSIDRGVANLRANWELVLLQIAQALVCALITAVGVVGLVVGIGASFLLRMQEISDWAEAVERLQGLGINGALLAVILAAFFTLVTVVSLIYCWFQAGILATLDRGERQAPPVRRLDWRLFRTFSGRDFAGWAGEGAWRYFSFFSGVFGLALLVMGGYLVVVVLLAAGTGNLEAGVPPLAGCLAALPLLAFGVWFNLFTLTALAVLARPAIGAWRASRLALGVVRRRLGALLLLVLLFAIAIVGVAVVFVPLSQGMAAAVPAGGAAWFVVQLLLTIAQWMLQAILGIALFAATIALVRGELDGVAA